MQELCEGALLAWAPAAAHTFPLRVEMCVYFGRFVLHITNGNIQLGLRPQSKAELTTHHKHTPQETSFLFLLLPEASQRPNLQQPRAAQSYSTNHTSPFLARTATPHL